MKILFDFTPDDGPIQQIVMDPATDADLTVLRQALAAGSPNDVLRLGNTRDTSSGGQPGRHLFRVGRISNLRTQA